MRFFVVCPPAFQAKMFRCETSAIDESTVVFTKDESCIACQLVEVVCLREGCLSTLLQT